MSSQRQLDKPVHKPACYPVPESHEQTVDYKGIHTGVKRLVCTAPLTQFPFERLEMPVWHLWETPSPFQRCQISHRPQTSQSPWCHVPRSTNTITVNFRSSKLCCQLLAYRTSILENTHRRYRLQYKVYSQINFPEPAHPAQTPWLSSLQQMGREQKKEG